MARHAGPVLTLRGSRATVTGNPPDALSILDVNGVTIGSIEAHIDVEGATIESVVIEADRRGFGYGGEAVRLIEAWAEAKGVDRFCASVDQTNGLGVYFLLRLGYRPSGLTMAADGRATLEMMRTPR